MFCLSKPSRNAVAKFISAQRSHELSYSGVGSSRERAPDGYIIDHNRIELGHGVETFQRAKRAVRQWKMFDMSWIVLCWPDTPIEPGACVAVLVSHLGFWSMNACRIVYAIDEQGPLDRFGFAYGTLPDHGESG